MLRCFIADDEPAARQRLQRLLCASSVLLLEQQELLLDDSLGQLTRRFDAAQFLRRVPLSRERLPALRAALGLDAGESCTSCRSCAPPLCALGSGL